MEDPHGQPVLVYGPPRLLGCQLLPYQIESAREGDEGIALLGVSRVLEINEAMQWATALMVEACGFTQRAPPPRLCAPSERLRVCTFGGEGACSNGLGVSQNNVPSLLLSLI